MTPIEPDIPEGSRLVVFAKDQPEFEPLPAAVDPIGTVTTEWEPTEDEVHALLCGGRLQLEVMTFGQPLQPVRLQVLPPVCGVKRES